MNDFIELFILLLSVPTNSNMKRILKQISLIGDKTKIRNLYVCWNLFFRLLSTAQNDQTTQLIWPSIIKKNYKED